MKYGIELTNTIDVVYSNYCRPYCKEWNIPQTAFDILMFLANNPKYTTARDVVEVRRIKPNLVSINIDKLVNLGYLERKAVEGDRRKVHLVLTKKADAIVKKGRKIQDAFVDELLEGIDPETIKVVQKAFKEMEMNLERMNLK